MEINAVNFYVSFLPVLGLIGAYFCVKAHEKTRRLSTLDKAIGIFVLADTLCGILMHAPYLWVRFVEGTTARKSSGFLADVLRSHAPFDKRLLGADPTTDAVVSIACLQVLNSILFFNSIAHGKTTRFFWQAVYATMDLYGVYIWIASDFFAGFKNLVCPLTSVSSTIIWAMLILRCAFLKYMCWQAYQAAQGKRGKSYAPPTPSSPRHSYNLRSKAD